MDKSDFTPHFAKPKPQQAQLDMLLKMSQEVQHIIEQQHHLNGRIKILHTSILQAITTLCSLQINQQDSNRKLGGQPVTTNTAAAHNFQTQILQKNCGRQRDSNSGRRIKGEHADHLTTTTDQSLYAGNV